MTAVRIEDYLTEDQMREIAIEEWRRICSEACNGHQERIISNVAHDVVVTMVAEALGETALEQIRAKAVSVIENLTEFTVFKRPDAWDRGPSPAYAALMDAVKNNKDLVDKKVGQCIAQLSKRDALEIIKSGVVQINPKAGT